MSGKNSDIEEWLACCGNLQNKFSVKSGQDFTSKNVKGVKLLTELNRLVVLWHDKDPFLPAVFGGFARPAFRSLIDR